MLTVNNNLNRDSAQPEQVKTKISDCYKITIAS